MPIMPPPSTLRKMLGIILNFDELCTWLKDLLIQVQDRFNKSNQKYAVQIFHRLNDDDKYSLEVRIYYKENEEYFEETIIAKISMKEIPDWARAELDKEDVTDLYNEKLKLNI